MTYSKCVEKALRELSHEDLVAYSIAATLVLAALSDQMTGTTGSKAFVCDDLYGITEEERSRQWEISHRVARRCKDLEQLQN